jgi:transcriptional regulator with XRE-family HTH domain
LIFLNQRGGKSMEKTFGAVLREKRRLAGIVQRDLASRIGVDFSYISKLENDRIPPPSADTIVAICEALNMEPEELLALTGKIPSAIQKSIGESKPAQEFLRESNLMDLTDEEWEMMKESLRNLRGDT